MDYKKLMDINEASEFSRIDKKMLQGWVESRSVPHYFVCKRGPLFSRRELTTWIELNQIKQIIGRPIPRIISITVNEIENSSALPIEIKSIKEICQYKFEAVCSGVYFLCNEHEIIYIGQSINIANRVNTHLVSSEFKHEIDAIYYLPLNTMELLRVERKFINEIKPKYNKPGQSYED